METRLCSRRNAAAKSRGIMTLNCTRSATALNLPPREHSLTDPFLYTYSYVDRARLCPPGFPVLIVDASIPLGMAKS